MLKSLFIELFWRINNKKCLVPRQYDNNDLGGMKKTGAIKNEMIKHVGFKNPLPAKIDFVETWHLSEMSTAVTKGGKHPFWYNKMKIVIYKADKEAPFTTAYNQLGSAEKIIFSNRSEKVTDFNNKSVDELIHLVESWLPKKSVIGSQEEDTIFYVPFEIKEKFMEILENLIDGFKKMMGKGERDSVPTSQELGLGKESSLGSFYDDEIEIQEVLTTMDHEKLQNFVDEISKRNNGVSGIAVINRTRGKTIVHSREPGADGDLVDLAKMLNWLAPIISLKKELDGDVAAPLVKKMKCFQNCVLHFEGGAVIIDFIDDSKVAFPVLIAYLNLNPELVGMAETTAETTSQKIIPLLQ
jgi:hypothetical protein